DVEGQFVNRLLQAHHLPLAHPKAQEDGAVAEIGAELNVGASIGSPDEHIGAAENLAHGGTVATIVRIPKDRFQIFFQREIEERIQWILIAHSRQLSDVFAVIFLVLRFHDLFYPKDVPSAMEIRRTRVRQIRPQLLPSFGIRKRLLAYFHGQEHQVLPAREYIKHLAVLALEGPHQRNRV